MELKNDPAWILNKFEMIPKPVLSIVVTSFMQSFFVSKRCTRSTMLADILREPYRIIYM